MATDVLSAQAAGFVALTVSSFLMESVRLESIAPLAYRTKVPLLFALIIFTVQRAVRHHCHARRESIKTRRSKHCAKFVPVARFVLGQMLRLVKIVVSLNLNHVLQIIIVLVADSRPCYVHMAPTLAMMKPA